MTQPVQPLPRKPPVPFTAERKQQFLDHYRETGLYYVAAQAVGVSSRTVDQHRKDDIGFGEEVEEAKQWWVDNVLVTAAVKRAIEGVSEPIFGGRFKDEQVGEKITYSDSMLALLMRSKRAEFRSNSEGGGGEGGAAGVLIVPSAPMTMDTWEEQHGEAAKGQTGRDKH